MATEQKKSEEQKKAPGPSDRRRPMGRRRFAAREKDEFDQNLIDLARVTRVMAGGKRMRFRACVVVGDKKGKVGWGLAKGADVSMAIQKAVTQGKKNLLTVSMVNGTIPHEVRVKFKAARLLLKPARSGRGLIAGGVVRSVLALAGLKDVVSKMQGSHNKINNVAATFKGLAMLRRVETPAKKPELKDEQATVTEKSAEEQKQE